jgi:hypothetical protein
MFAILRTGGRLTGAKFATMETIKRSARQKGRSPIFLDRIPLNDESVRTHATCGKKNHFTLG